MQCADEAIVVNNSQPMKAGNSLEDKTERTLCIVIVTGLFQKNRSDAKGGSSFKMIEHFVQGTLEEAGKNLK